VSPPAAPDGPPDRPPETALSGPVDLILIEKSARTLTLIQDGQPVRSWRIALGFAPKGDKARQGDGRTPEGSFRIDRRNGPAATTCRSASTIRSPTTSPARPRPAILPAATS
jgi:hypothetical protein